jgi:DNA polymerase sigma
MLSKFASYNPFSQFTPKEKSKYSTYKDRRKTMPFNKERDKEVSNKEDNPFNEIIEQMESDIKRFKEGNNG